MRVHSGGGDDGGGEQVIADFRRLSVMERYLLMTQAVIPRPVAWMLTENEGESGSGVGGRRSFNLAPFSYFNALSSDPPLVGVSVTEKPEGGEKDTLLNVRRTGMFAAHIAPMGMLEELNASSAGLPYGESELERLGLKTELFGDFGLPRVAGCPAVFGCDLHQEVRLGPTQVLILGEVRLLYAAEEVLEKDAKGRTTISAEKMNPVARLGAGNYAGLGKFAVLKRPG